MRVAYLTTQAVSGDGWGRYTVEVVRGAMACGVEPILITANPEIDEALRAVPHYPILPDLFSGRLTTPRLLLKAPRVRALVGNTDLLHCIVEPMAPLAMISRAGGTPYVLSTHGPWSVEPLARRTLGPLFRRAFRAADAIACNSGYICKRMNEALTLPQSRVISGGVHLEPFETPVDIDMPGWVGHEPYVMSAGAVKTRKGNHITLEAVAQARQHIPNLHYVMAGSVTAAPEFVAMLRGRAEELGISDNVHFLGPLDPHRDLIAWYQHAAVFVLASVNVGYKFEGLGLVYLEAEAAGTPAIGTFECGAEEAIADGESGLLVPQNDPAALTDAIVRIVGDPAERARLSAGAKEHARRMSWENMTGRMAALYEELVG